MTGAVATVPFGQLIREAYGDSPEYKLDLRDTPRFSSKIRDEATGLTYYGYRYYDPTTFKWLTRDPLNEQGGINMTAFCNNDPINAFDPLGLSWTTDSMLEAFLTEYGDEGLDYLKTYMSMGFTYGKSWGGSSVDGWYWFRDADLHEKGCYIGIEKELSSEQAAKAFYKVLRKRFRKTSVSMFFNGAFNAYGSSIKDAANLDWYDESDDWQKHYDDSAALCKLYGADITNYAQEEATWALITVGTAYTAKVALKALKNRRLLRAVKLAQKNADETADLAARAWRRNPDSFYGYDELKVLVKEAELSGRNIGFESHHLLEKQFARKLGINPDKIISVPLTPKWHRNVLGMGNNLDAAITKQLKKMGTNPDAASVNQIWKAHRNVYNQAGYHD